MNEQQLVAEIQKLSAENPLSAKKLADWFDTTQGRPGTLVNTGEDGYHNFFELQKELRGREVTKDTIHQAMLHIGAPTKTFRKQLVYVLIARQVNPQQQPTDPNHKPGELISPEGMVRTADGGWRNKNAAEQAADRRAAEATKTAAPTESSVQAQAKERAQSRQGNTHSQTHQIQKLILGNNGIVDWVATDAARKRLQDSFSKREIR